MGFCCPLPTALLSAPGETPGGARADELAARLISVALGRRFTPGEQENIDKHAPLIADLAGIQSCKGGVCSHNDHSLGSKTYSGKNVQTQVGGSPWEIGRSNTIADKNLQLAPTDALGF